MKTEEFFLYLILISSYLFFTGYFAHSKGRSLIFWSLSALVLPVITQVALFLMPGKVSRELEETGMNYEEEKQMEQIIRLALRKKNNSRVVLKNDPKAKKKPLKGR